MSTPEFHQKTPRNYVIITMITKNLAHDEEITKKHETQFRDQIHQHFMKFSQIALMTLAGKPKKGPNIFACGAKAPHPRGGELT